MSKMKERLKKIVDELEDELRCNCDLDNWQPEPITGHSCVCRIHKGAISKYRKENHLGG